MASSSETASVPVIMAALWTFVAVFALVSFRPAFSFDLMEFLELAGGDEMKNYRRSLTTPADVVVNVFLDLLDANNDRDISLSEFEDFIDRLVNVTYSRYDDDRGQQRARETKGYAMTLAILLDADQSGTIEINELRSKLQLFFSIAGGNVAGNFIMMQLFVEDRISPEGYSRENKALSIVNDFMTVFDSNKDGRVSAEERQISLGRGRYAWSYFNETVDKADTNHDSSLNKAESRLFLTIAARDAYSLFRIVYVYTKMFTELGEDTANRWLER